MTEAARDDSYCLVQILAAMSTFCFRAGVGDGVGWWLAARRFYPFCIGPVFRDCRRTAVVGE